MRDARAPAPPLVAVSTAEGIASVLLDRPDRLNAASPALVEALHTSLRAAIDEGARVVVLSGSGRAFCAGHDLKEPALAAGSPEETTHLSALQEITRMLRSPGIISIAAVHGFALGAGLEFALSCDFVVADRSCVFGFPEVSVGLSVTGGISYLLPQAVGLPRAKELILLGERFSATRAAEFGLVNRLSDEGEHVDVARGLAERMTQLPHYALTLAKEALEYGVRHGLDDAIELEIANARSTGASAEATSGRDRFSIRDGR